MEPYLDYFLARGHDVYFLALSHPITTKNKDCVIDISYGAKGRTFFSKWKYLLSPFKLRKILKELKPDIMHGHYVTSAGVVALLSGFRPFIISVRGSDLLVSSKYFIWRIILRFIFAKSAVVHTVSDELSKRAKELGVSEMKIETFTQGVDTSLFSYRSDSRINSPVRLLCTRSLREHPYEPLDILQACLILKQSDIDFKLTFAASGPMEDDLKKRALGMEILDNIVFIGGYDNSSLPTIMAEHDIYISAALWDGTSVSLLEAMSCGLFPIVSKTTSNNAWIEDGKTGLMFECGNAKVLASQIMQIISNENLFQTAIAKNHSIVEKKADRKKNMKVLENIYYNVLEKKKFR